MKHNASVDHYYETKVNYPAMSKQEAINKIISIDSCNNKDRPVKRQ